MKTHVHLHFFTSDTVVALVIKVQDVPMAGCLCYRGYQGYHYGSLLSLHERAGSVPLFGHFLSCYVCVCAWCVCAHVCDNIINIEFFSEMTYTIFKLVSYQRFDSFIVRYGIIFFSNVEQVMFRHQTICKASRGTQYETRRNKWTKYRCCRPSTAHD